MRPLLSNWNELPDFMRTAEVRPYWELLDSRRGQLAAKRLFDVCGSLALLGVLSPAMAVIAIAVKADSPGPVMFRQERVTRYGKRFRIHKFRTMVDGAERLGSSVTTGGDSRVTRVGQTLRRYRLDEFPQLIDVLVGDMSFVGTRPEVPKYVERYQPEYLATLLLPAGITSEASIRFKNEDEMLAASTDVDCAYVNSVLPEKMRWNLASLANYSFFSEISTMVRTVLAVIQKDDAPIAVIKTGEDSV